MFEKYKKVYKADYEKWYKENEAYRQRVAADQDRLKFHLMPKTGWLNDPNGLCQFNGTYHIYYQYTPFEPTGELKTWGHYTTKDFIHYEDFGPVVFPDEDIDAHGVYSGSAFIEDDTIHYFYTGNLKYFDRDDYDYINSGRGSNTITFTSKDGYEFTKKELLMTTDDYPADMSNHVRDPKIFKKNEKYYMVLGARDVEGVGMILLYESTDLKNWTYKNRITTPQKFGYMWECPNYLSFEKKKFLFCCPQGLESHNYDYEAIYQNGYFPLTADLEKDCVLEDFIEFDHGFDIYAQQFFKDEKGRMIMAGWMGLPDIDYTNPTIEEGRQHAFTLFREITEHEGRLYQFPIEEYKSLREEKKEVHGTSLTMNTSCFECHITDLPQSFKLHLRGVNMNYEDGLLTIDMNKSGSGRGVKHIKIPEMNNMTLFSDTSSLELFINDGAYAFTTRIYNNSDTIEIISNKKIDMTAYQLKAID